jgi:hypothetical protein
MLIDVGRWVPMDTIRHLLDLASEEVVEMDMYSFTLYSFVYCTR